MDFRYIRRHFYFKWGLTVAAVACLLGQAALNDGNFIINLSQTLLTIVWLHEV